MSAEVMSAEETGGVLQMSAVDEVPQGELVLQP